MSTTASADPVAVGPFIEELRGRGVDLRADGEALRVSAPKGVIDAALAARITQHKPAILAHLRSAAATVTEAIPVAPRGAPLPLGLVQQRMWLHNLMEPDTVLYNLPAAWRLGGRLELERFSQAFTDVVARHEVMRVVIAEGVAGPTQRFVPVGEAALEYEDLAALPAEAREATLMSRLHAIRDAPIDLACGPPYRASLFRVGPEEHVFYFMPHHVIWDGWSFDIFLRDLDAAYAARVSGREVQWPQLPIQYADYAVWHRQWMRSGAMQRQVDYWAGVLEGDLQPLDLPTDLPRPRVFSHRGDWEEFTLAAGTIERAARLAGAHRGTVFMVLLAAWVAFLHRLTGQGDIVVGAPVQARQAPEVADLIGCFVNTICLRQRIDPGASFAQLVDEVRDTCLGAYENQDAPVDALIERLVARNDPSRTPLFQAMFSHQQVSRRARALGPLAVSQVHVNPAATPTDLMLAVMEGAAGARGVIHYSTDLFSAATIRRMRERFEAFLGAALAQPATCLFELPMVTAGEREELARWNATARATPAVRNVAELLGQGRWEANADTAIESDETLSYAELESRSNRLARMLRGKGIGRGALVGLCIERSARMVVAQLAVLKSGAAYVPLDPAYPADRLAYMASDAGLALLLTESSLASTLAAARVESVSLDTDDAGIRSQHDTALAPDPDRDARPEDPAYVIYTSGSTGKPKGVAVPQAAVVNFLTSMAREPGLRGDDRLVAVTTLSFDIAVLELLLPLSLGARVVLASRDQAMDGHALRALLEASAATVMQATPGTWRMLLDAGWRGGPRFKALIGGEGLPADLARSLLDCTGELWNMYGPTETTVWSTCWKVERPEGGIRVGRAIDNTQVHVLDPYGQPCPIGVAGEVVIGGDGVALGYLGRPELTAERFVPDPFRDAPGARLYRTGDRGRWDADGQLEHLGRLDFQVKVRGHRIELGEIEAALATHPEVAQAVVVVREDSPGDVRLAAYVVPRGADADAGSLRDHLRKSLPAYMIPQGFVALTAIPLLPNGKIDRRALPLPAQAASRAPAGAHAAPRSETEKVLAEIWRDLLKVDHVNADDNFFDLGGHSLLVMQALLLIEARVGRRVTPNRFIFESLAQIARAYDEALPPKPPKARGLRGLLSSFLGAGRAS